jgi:hypothetical protein
MGQQNPCSILVKTIKHNNTFIHPAKTWNNHQRLAGRLLTPLTIDCAEKG